MDKFMTVAHLAGGYQVSRILMTAVELRVFDALEQRPRTAGEVASARACDARAMELLLNALVALELIQKNNGEFSLTEVSEEYLVSSAAKYYGHMIEFDSGQWDEWGELTATIRTGKPAREANMFQDDPAMLERFIMGMHSIVSARGDAPAVLEAVDMSGWTSLLDIGGGPGTYPLHFMDAHHDLRVTIFDLPGTLAITRTVTATHPARDRLTLVEGDFNTDPLPSGFDAVLLSNIVHSETLEANEALMKKVFAALNPGGVAIVKDHILSDDGTAPPFGALFSIVMLLFTRGRSYTQSEIRGWYETAGFINVREAHDAMRMANLMIGDKPE